MQPRSRGGFDYLHLRLTRVRATVGAGVRKFEGFVLHLQLREFEGLGLALGKPREWGRHLYRLASCRVCHLVHLHCDQGVAPNAPALSKVL